MKRRICVFKNKSSPLGGEEIINILLILLSCLSPSSGLLLKDIHKIQSVAQVLLKRFFQVLMFGVFQFGIAVDQRESFFARGLDNFDVADDIGKDQ